LCEQELLTKGASIRNVVMRRQGGVADLEEEEEEEEECSPRLAQ